MFTSGLSFKEQFVNNYKCFDNIKDFSIRLNVSEPTFLRRFKEEFGMTSYEWFEKRKAEHILKLLISTDKTLDEISYDVGISSVSYLSAFCKKHLGITPSEIRTEKTSEKIK